MCAKSLIGAAATVTFLAALLPEGARADLIVNGSFESPTVPVGSYINFVAGSTGIPGWTVLGVDSAVVSGAFVQSGIAFQAQHGVQFLDTAGITANSSSSGVSQTVPTVIGARYTLRFYVGSSTDNSLFFPSTVDVRIDGGPRLSYTNPNAPTTQLNWMQFALTFTATSTTTNIAFLNGSAASNYQSLIDNVTLEADPGCLLDYNLDGSLNPDDIGDYITDYFTFPPVPGPGGYAILCPDNDPPYDQGYKTGYTSDASGQCGEPNPDNLGDWITDYFIGC